MTDIIILNCEENRILSPSKQNSIDVRHCVKPEKKVSISYLYYTTIYRVFYGLYYVGIENKPYFIY